MDFLKMLDLFFTIVFNINCVVLVIHGWKRLESTYRFTLIVVVIAGFQQSWELFFKRWA